MATLRLFSRTHDLADEKNCVEVGPGIKTYMSCSPDE